MSIRSRLVSLALALVALFAVGHSTANALPGEPQQPVTVCGTPVLPGAEAVQINAPMGSAYSVVFTNEFGISSMVACGCVGQAGTAMVMAPAIGLTPIGPRYLTVRVMTGGQMYLFRLDSTDPLFLWQ